MPAAAVVIDAAGIERLDTAGAWLLLRTEHELAARGNRVELTNLRPSLRRCSSSCGPRRDARRRRIRSRRITRFSAFSRSRRSHRRRCSARGYSILGFGGLVFVTDGCGCCAIPAGCGCARPCARWSRPGLTRLPIVGLLSFLIGVVMAYQGADQLRRFGGEIYTVNLLGITILRELGVLLTAIIIAGRSGSAFTAQIGTMQVNQEIDALRTLGLDPIEVLVLPRVFGLMLTLPLLVFYADALGLIGGCLMTWATLGITVPAFLRPAARRDQHVDLVGRRHQGAVLRRDHRDGRLLRGLQRVGQRRERRPADDAVGRRIRSFSSSSPTPRSRSCSRCCGSEPMARSSRRRRS